MAFKNLTINTFLTFFLLALSPATQAMEDGIGQTIKIHTHLDSFIGRPSWLLMIRDIDHNQNVPYVYDFTDGNNFWLAFTYSRNYLIIASTLQFAPYKANPYRTRTIRNFCGLESSGRINRGISIHVTLTGNLTPDTNTFQCNVLRYADTNFTVVK